MQQKQTNNPFASMEDEVLNFWDRAEIFKKSVERPAPHGDYVFYDGPPFGTGEPHYGHLLSSIAKDVIPRFWTMQGWRVERRWGWDCHGLPIENIIEQDLKISGKKQIEKIGIDKFNEACRARVLEYADIWEKMVRRIGRWAEFKNSYKTMDLTFMESVWWGFKQLWNKGLIYQGRKVLLYCPRCETPISNFEVAMDNSYKDISETSVYVKFKVKNAKEKFGVDSDVYILAWTTTPWTLPGNVALAVGESIKYQVLSIKGGKYIVAKDRLEIIKEEYEVVKEIKGKDLVGLEYEPLFDVPLIKNSGKKAYYVASGDFVTTEDGTGVVHTAVVYGEDDYNLGLKLDLPVMPALDEKGYFNETVPQFKGVYFTKANHLIIDDLDKRGLLFAKQDITHSYPHCHRCDTQLFYNAIPAWFLNIGKIRKRMLELNEKINWFPGHLKHGRFALGIEQAPDWNISRNRFFATPIPIWQCDECGEREVISSVSELENKVDFGKFYILRHGEADNNVQEIYSYDLKGRHKLTNQGIEGVKLAAKELKNKGIELIVASDFIRAKQTAAIIAQELGLNVSLDERLREINVGDLNYKSFDDDLAERRRRGSDEAFPGGENWTGVRNRLDIFYKDLLAKYKNKTILLVSHGDTLTALEAYLMDGDFLGNIKKINDGQRYIKKAETRKLRHRVKDIHSHFIDETTWPCAKCGGTTHRIKEVFDCWVESGSMPFAQMHYPFANKEKFENNFPAQFISEYISQTRAWFYVMHVMSAALFDSHSFANVIATGVILNEKGEKMSKSKKNYPDPWKVINEYGVDALRFYLMSSSVMAAENLFFNERDLRDVFRKNIMILWNVYKFYEMHADEAGSEERSLPECENVLDKWILARLNVLAKEVTMNMKNYNLPKALRPVSEFINDFSTWYIRRSRDRFKDSDQKEMAVKTTGFILLELAKIIAPVMPFMAEQIWQKVTGYDFKDENKSVHLTAWVEYDDPMEAADVNMLKQMEEVRKIVELGLAKRDEAGIKVRQTLQKFSIFNFQFSINEEYLNLIKDELNVREVIVEKGKGELRVELDTTMTDELKLEGLKREIVRQVNSMRKQAGLTIKDKIVLSWQSDSELVKNVFKKMAEELKKDTLSEEIVEGKVEGEEVKVNGEKIKLGIKRV